MSGNKLIFNAFATRLKASPQSPAITSKDLAKREATIKKLANHIGVPAEHVRALVNGDSVKLATAAPAHLRSLATYLTGAGEKQLKKDKSNGPELLHYGKTLKDAYTLFQNRHAAAAEERRATAQNSTFERAIQNAKRGGQVALQAALPDVPGSHGVQVRAKAVLSHRQKSLEPPSKNSTERRKPPGKKRPRGWRPKRSITCSAADSLHSTKHWLGEFRCLRAGFYCFLNRGICLRGPAGYQRPEACALSG